MENLVDGERASDILATARSAGFFVSERQLEWWHIDDLLPRPTQFWIEGKAGSSAIYPVGTSDQLIALCNIRRKVRQSQKIGWVLWWHGFSVGEQYWKKQLESRAASYDKSLPIVIAAIRDELSDYHSGLFAHLRKVRIRNVLFRQLRKRLGRERFDNFLFLLTEILQGNFDGWPPGIVPNDPDLIRDKMTFDRALGLFRARSEADIKNNPGLHDDVENVLVTLSRRLGGSHCRAYRTNQARKN